MLPKPLKILSLFLCFLLIFEQSLPAGRQAAFAQVAGSTTLTTSGQLDIASRLAALHSSFTLEKFRPLHLRYLSYDNQANNFKLFLDKGDAFVSTSNNSTNSITQATQELLNYFFIGISLPNDSFWVNLRPDSPDNIIDNYLAQTDVGKILLEADLQLKKDTAAATSPQTPEGKKYWAQLYKKAEELFGSDNITIPTLTRPWIVPAEIIIRETKDSAYIYKATLKVMLEEDYLNSTNSSNSINSIYSFKDPRLKALNEYSSQLLRELIIPKLNKEVNSSKRYAALRQVYYSLILAQWFKSRFQGLIPKGTVPALIDSRNLTNLMSKQPWSKTAYFKEYQNSFKDGEYNLKEPIYTPYGQSVRSYFSGGMSLGLKPQDFTEFGTPKLSSSPVTTLPAVSSSPAVLRTNGMIGIYTVAGSPAIGQIGEIKIVGVNPVEQSAARSSPPTVNLLEKDRTAHIPFSIRSHKVLSAILALLIAFNLAIYELGDRIDYFSYNNENLRFIRQSFSILKETSLRQHNGLPVNIKNSLNELEKLEKEKVHYISIDEVKVVEEIRRLPQNIKDVCIQSAQAYNLPPRLLVASIINLYERHYDFEVGINILVKRGALTENEARAIRAIIPDKLEKMSLGGKWDAFLGGIILNGKATMGSTGLRPAWVQRYNAWKRFNIDATKLSNQKIAWMLLDPKYHFEAVAAFWRGMIDETKRYRENAILFNEGPRMDVFDKEAIRERSHWLAWRPYPTVEYYKLVPDPKNLGSEEWMLAMFHPMYYEWTNQTIELHKMIIKSGIFDNKPAEFVGQDAEKLRSFLKSNDPYIREAAKRSLKKLSSDATFFPAASSPAQDNAANSAAFLPKQEAGTRRTTSSPATPHDSDSLDVFGRKMPSPYERYKTSIAEGVLPARLQSLANRLKWPIKMDDKQLPPQIINFYGEYLYKPIEGRESEIHPEIDIAVPAGTGVSAVQDGIVIYMQRDSYFRNKLSDLYIYSPESDLVWIYAHLDTNSIPNEYMKFDKWPTYSERLMITDGKLDKFPQIKAGQQIGSVGIYKIVTRFDHLHLQIADLHNISPRVIPEERGSLFTPRAYLNPLLLLEDLYDTKTTDLSKNTTTSSPLAPQNSGAAERPDQTAASPAQGNAASSPAEVRQEEGQFPSTSQIGRTGTVPANTGGIDFRALPIVTQAVANLSAMFRDSPLRKRRHPAISDWRVPRLLRGQSLEKINLAQEWRQIQKMLDAGITPSAERIKEYLQVSCTKGNILQDKDKVILCIADILRSEEETCSATDPTLHDILVVLEVSGSDTELSRIFLG